MRHKIRQLLTSIRGLVLLASVTVSVMVTAFGAFAGGVSNAGFGTGGRVTIAATQALTISGHLRNVNGRGLNNENVVLTGDASLSTQTDANGAYSFTVAAGGTYNVAPNDSRVSSWLPLDSIDFTNLAQNVSNADFAANFPTFTVSGAVKNGSGTTFPGAKVRITGTNITTKDYVTNSSGSYTSDQLNVLGDYTFTPQTFTASGTTYSSFSPTNKLFTGILTCNPGPGVTCSGFDYLGVNFVASAAPGGLMQFSAANYNVGEGGGMLAVTVTRSGDTSGASSVDYASSDGSAKQTSDYLLASGTLNFAAGETSKTFFVLIVDDVYVESSESVNLTLSNATGGTLGTQSTATLTIADNDTTQSATNPLDNADANFFVTQQYYDFLSRGSDAGGFSFWVSQITQCGSDQACIRSKRIIVSNAFFYEQEYQQTAAYVFRLYRATFGNTQPFPNPDANNQSLTAGQRAEALKLPSYAVFARDRAALVGSANLTADQQALANAFVTRAEFLTKYPASLTLSQFVDAVVANILAADGADLSSQKAALVALGTRGAVMYRIANDDLAGGNGGINNRAFIDAEYNRSFVASQYYGYLRRDADIGGFLFWLGQINSAPLRSTTKQSAMVCSFVTAAEYQLRFSSVVTHSNAECPQ